MEHVKNVTDETRRARNAEHQRRHKYALMSELRQLRAELEVLPQRVAEVLDEREQQQKENRR